MWTGFHIQSVVMKLGVPAAAKETRWNAYYVHYFTSMPTRLHTYLLVRTSMFNRKPETVNASGVKRSRLVANFRHPHIPVGRCAADLPVCVCLALPGLSPSPLARSQVPSLPPAHDEAGSSSRVCLLVSSLLVPPSWPCLRSVHVCPSKLHQLIASLLDPDLDPDPDTFFKCHHFSCHELLHHNIRQSFRQPRHPLHYCGSRRLQCHQHTSNPHCFNVRLFIANTHTHCAGHGNQSCFRRSRSYPHFDRPPKCVLGS